ncbi:insecticidal toxin complex protein [Ktedonobacteria bacterium brp13]|nr:insecticidal toxin complex protein [Ktedonobacteria bacterium brp13]
MSNYLVIRLTPSSPVDGATFATYLEDLQIQVFPANPPPGTTPQSLGKTVYSSPLILSQVPGLSKTYLGVVSRPTSSPTAQVRTGNYGTKLEFASTAGISIGSWLVSAGDKSFFLFGNTVIDVKEDSVTLSKPLPNYVPAGTIATFIQEYDNVTPWATDPPALSIELKTSAVAAKAATVLPFTSTNKISVGMTVSPQPGIIDNQTIVTEANETSVTLSKPLLDKLPKDTAVTFTFNLSSGIIQHVESTGFDIFGFRAVSPAAVATAIVELNSPPPAYLNVSVVALRDSQQIPVDPIFYNVLVSTDALPSPDQYQTIPSNATSFYLTLPPPPINKQAISLIVPSDGTAPQFGPLYSALQDVLTADPIVSLAYIGKNGLTANQCSRLAYEIIWSQQNVLPAPPDPLEQLYTNPPNSGSSKGDGGNDEQDRQKFEGDVKSFYATRNAEAQHLAGFIYSLATALFCYEQSKDATSVRFDFPIIDDNTTLTTIKDAAVLFTKRDAQGHLLPLNPDFTDPGFAVPAEYFYVLCLNLPPKESPLQQYQMAILANEQQILDKLHHAIDVGIIDGPQDPTKPPDPHAVPITPEQAARNLAALGVLGDTDPECPLNKDIKDLAQAWLKVRGDDTALDNFWQGTPSAVITYAAGYLDLILYLVTNNFQPLIDAIKKSTATGGLGISTVEELAKLKIQDWETFFSKNANLLPPFTAPGSLNQPPPTNPKVIKERADVFVRNLQSFFEVSAHSSQAPSVNPNVPPTLYREDPDKDPILEFIKAYAGFAFGPGIDPEQQVFKNALDAVFPNDPLARAWLKQTILAINAVYVLTTNIPQPPQPPIPTPPPNPPPILPDFRFSMMEALYARGFTSLQSVLNLSLDDFQQALTGTVAYSYAALIQSNAGTWQPVTSQEERFQSVNPDGCLVNCIPPLYLSQLGPVAYLQEMLLVSEDSTCENPKSTNLENTLEWIVAHRRGNLGKLEVTEANLETPLPRIDLVNECLEALVATPGSSSGVIYKTAGNKLDEHWLCTEGSHSDADKSHSGACHHPATLFETLPQYSSPATPVAQANAYDTLSKDFSSPLLPYAQALDISRSYLRHLETSRYAVMRRFRKEITEFVLDPAGEPADFQRHLWRYPVRVEIAREYLGITPEEYDLLFTQDIVTVPTGNQLLLWQLYGFNSETVGDTPWTEAIVTVPEFIRRTGLTYCEFLELWRANFVRFRRAGYDGTFPDCEPCCLDTYIIQFEDPEATGEALKRLAVFIRLWRKLRHVQGARYSFTQLCDICNVLKLFNNGSINPDFIRQLAAFQMLRDHLDLRLTDSSNHQSSAGQTGADRTHLLALWVGTSAGKWTWAVQHLLDRIQHYARMRHQCGSRPAHFIKLLAENLDQLSSLAGFDTDRPADTWHALPTHTLRFAEVLSKIYASDFSVGEILFLFTVGCHLDGDDPFPLPDDNEALDFPLAFPDDEEVYSLWALRRKLLKVHISEEDAEKWTWRHIESSLHHEFGYESMDSADPLLSLGEHFFPDVLSACGNYVDTKQRQYRVCLDATKTNAAMWNTPDSPFRYDMGTHELWIRLPLTDEEVFEKLSHIRQLNQDEQEAVQNLYFAPRVDLVAFAFIFSNFGAAVEHLIQEDDEEKRWAYFRHEFARCHARSRVIAGHLAHHVGAATGQEQPDGVNLAWRLLQHLFADENRAKSSWEMDCRQVPAVCRQVPDVTWQPQPLGGAFAALLGLTGTGLLGEFTPERGPLTWREVRGPMSAFGHEKNRWNIPVPTILPSMDLTLTPAQTRFVGIRNGFAIRGQNGDPLGGPQGFEVRWRGILLVESEGMYEFYAGAPTPDGEKPDFEAAEQRRWRLTLKRGQKTWIVLSHHWHNTQAPSAHAAPLSLKSGAYQITVEFTQPEAEFTQIDTRQQHTGFQVKYCGPDSDNRLVAIPLDRLYRDEKDGTLGDEIDRGGTANMFLKLHFTSTLRDMRRTYQRAFKALLFAQRFGLSAKPISDYGQSEIGYMLAHPDLFQGTSYYRQEQNVGFGTHHAYFDFNFLPLLDNYHAPAPTEDQRVQPSIKRQQALFDWWERIFDYAQLRKETRHAHEHPLWLLFDEAAEEQPDNPAPLLHHMGIDLGHADLTTHYYQDYSVTSDDLEDERWAIRIWRAEKWIRDLLSDFVAKDIREARPDLWASDDPNAVLTGLTGQPQSGNDNLTRFVRDGCIERGAPRRYRDVRQLNDELRKHARQALLAYLCGMNHVRLPWGGYAQEADDLSALLLLDVEASLCEKASRIEDAISAVQIYVQRCRLGLETGLTVSPEFILLWDRRFSSFRVWQVCKRREIYRENWIDWEEIQTAQGSEAFRFLETELQRAMLTAPRSGGLEYWPDQGIPAHEGLALIQSREPDHLQQFPMPSKQEEGFTLLGTQERDARPSWLAALQTGTSSDGNTNTNPENSNTRENTVATTLVQAGQSGTAQDLPLWIQAAIRLGVHFLRVAAAGEPPASTRFAPRHAEEETGCCCTCGKRHPAVMDEYYFWLIDSRYYDDLNNPLLSKDATPPQDAGWDWEIPEEVPQLLHWDSKPMVQLAWCRVHNGEFQQPRRSVESVFLDGKKAPELLLLGRSDDSLTFKVDGGLRPTGYNAPEEPGFRYDLATDEVVTLPLVVTPPGTGASYPPGLSAYPYFAYFSPGASLIPPSHFSTALAVAEMLGAHCRFEEALKWYELAFNPLKQDCSWCPQESQNIPISTTEQPTRVSEGTPPVRVVEETAEQTTSASENVPPTGNGMPCCASVWVSDQIAQNRSITLHYIETLHQWGDALMRRNSPEAFQQARLIVDTEARILGMRPRSVKMAATGDEHERPTPLVINFQPACAPLNPRLLALYDLVDDRLELIHTCLNTHRLREDHHQRDRSYWGNTELRNGWQTDVQPCTNEQDECCPHSPYRFMFLIQKAQELASQVRELGSALLTEFEKGDAEYLASLRELHERQLLDLTLEIRQNQWREADWQVQALKKTQESSQTRRQYNALLIQNGLISGEIQHETLTDVALSGQEAGRIMEGIGAIVGLIPDVNVGTLDFATLPIGSKLASVFSAMSQISNSQAGSAGTTGSLRLTQSGWDRRLADWRQQVQVLDIENDQIERQILAAERRRDIALRELNNHQQQMEHAAEIQAFLRDKFTNDALYLYLQTETADLYFRMYELALCAAGQAQRAFNYERGHTMRRFLPDEVWDNLHEGLLVGERLQLALRQMEKAYLDENVREHELTKHFSLRLHFPLEFLRLKTTGSCEIDIPEWMFDLDYPGHYMRRIRNVSLTIPCVVGPYTGVHCRLTLLRSMTRVHPRLRDPLVSCCDDNEFDNGYRPGYDDPRIVTQYAATEAIATSSGQNDSGLFELNFRDERYLPFEFMGAVSRWCIELPQENNQFDVATITDVILHLNYTAREGGDVLRRAANAVAQCHLPGDGWQFFDFRHDLSEAWHRFQSGAQGEGARKLLGLRLGRNMFPFPPGQRELRINHLEIFFEASEIEPGRHLLVEFLPGPRSGYTKEDRDDDKVYAIDCIASTDWPGLYHGVLNIWLGPLQHQADHNLGTFRFPCDSGVVSNAFLFCGYEVTHRSSDVGCMRP